MSTPLDSHTEPSRTSFGRLSLVVFLFFSCLLILFSSGRLSSEDAGNQLQAATLFHYTGHLGGKNIEGTDKGLWVRNSVGDYYEAHDIGNIVLMFPAALLGAYGTHGSAASKIAHPPILARLGVSMTYALFSAVGCCFLFRLFALFYPLRVAFLSSLAFITTTYFWAYTKSAYDVLGACIGVCALLYFAAKLLKESRPSEGDIACLVLALVTAGAFRYSLLPFLTLGTLACLFVRRSALRWSHIALALLVFTLGILPTLVYNKIRMGSIFVPATTAPQFASTGALTAPELPGLYGLLISPNKGFFEFNPVLLFVLVLPFFWKRLSTPTRLLCGIFGVASFMYICAIAKVPSWSSVSWGPRYLLPVLPFFFFAAVACLLSNWTRHKALCGIVIALSTLTSLAPALVNWHLASSQDSRASLPFAGLPYQQMAVWHGLALGLQGRPLPAPAKLLADPIRSGGARFPDLWTFRLMESSRKGLAAGLLVSLLLLGALLLSGTFVLHQTASAGSGASSLYMSGKFRNT